MHEQHNCVHESTSSTEACGNAGGHSRNNSSLHTQVGTAAARCNSKLAHVQHETQHNGRRCVRKFLACVFFLQAAKQWVS
jgi:hypothetical protein